MRFLFALAFLFGGLSAQAADALKKPEVTIALAGPMTGPQAVFGEQMKNGAQLAVDDINKAGGVLGQKINLRLFDDVCDPKQAVTVANQIVAASIPLVIGHFCSGSSIPASNVYAEEGTLMISPGSSNPQLTDAGHPTVFRTVGRDDQQGAIAADYIAKHFAGKKIAIAHDKQTYSKGLADAVANSLKAKGIDVAMRETVNPGERDYSAFVTKMKEAGIDLLFYGGYHTESGLIIRQMREQNMHTVLMAGDALATQEFWAITGKAGEGTLMTFSPDLTKDPRNAELVKRFLAKNIKPEGYTIYTYATVQLWAAAVNKIAAAEPSKVAAALKANTFETALGPISFDNKGDLKGNTYVVYRWHDGKYEAVE